MTRAAPAAPAPGRRRAALVLVLAAVALLAACSGDGRELAEPTAEQTTTTPSSGALPTVTTAAAGLSLSSPAFTDGGPIPASMACPENTSPPLTWTGVPPGTVELALVVTDPDAAGFVHWVVAGIDPSATGLDQGAVPAGAVEARNGDGGVGWFGPCPPAGETHTYEFRLLAFVEPVGLQPGLEAAAAVAALTGATAEVTYTGTYTR